MTQTQIAETFSNGKFNVTYRYLDDNVQWTVVGEDFFDGKVAVIDNCELVAGYFNSVTTKFETTNIIADNNKVAITGTAEFLRDGKRVNFVSACDVYEFNQDNKIQTITSYCIQNKNCTQQQHLA